MLREISASQHAEWEAFFALEPWGYEVENFRTGQVCATVANFAGMRLKEGTRMAPSDFMPGETRQPAGRDLSAEIHASFSSLVS